MSSVKISTLFPFLCTIWKLSVGFGTFIIRYTYTRNSDKSFSSTCAMNNQEQCCLIHLFDGSKLWYIEWTRCLYSYIYDLEIWIYIVSNTVKNYDQNTNVRRTKVNPPLNSFDDPDMIPCQGVHQWNEKEYFMTLFIRERNATCDFLIISAHL